MFDLSFDSNEDYDDRWPRKQGWDADRDSPQLRLGYELLWSQDISTGQPFAPAIPSRKSDGHLIWATPSGARQCYGSDAITHSYRKWENPKALADAKDGLSPDQRAKYLTPDRSFGTAST